MDELIEIEGVQYSYNYELDEYTQVIPDLNSSSNSDNKPDNKTENNHDNYWFPENPDIDLWEVYLSRQLVNEEKEILSNVLEEEDINKQIQKIKSNISSSNCFIPKLTKSNGNCLFESLSILGLGENDLGIDGYQAIRNNISSVLLYVRNCYDFFPNLSLTPEEIFDNANEIEMIKNKTTNAVYMYNYDLMICDLRTNRSWKRLPAELILMTISRVYQVKILIHHNNSQYINVINVWGNHIEDSKIDIIRLALINEQHYVPIMQIPGELLNDPDIIQEIGSIDLEYSDALGEYQKWIDIMTRSIHDSYNNNNQTSKSDKQKAVKWSIQSAETLEPMDLDNFDFI
jgi:hypothetical protein